MGLIVDTNVLIAFERQDVPVDFSRWQAFGEVFLSVVTVSELLMGVHRANDEGRLQRRSKFVEAVLDSIPVLEFTSVIARRHAQIYADLAQRGQLIGAHDMIIAATALHHGFSLLTENVDEFSRVSNLNVIRFDEGIRE